MSKKSKAARKAEAEAVEQAAPDAADAAPEPKKSRKKGKAAAEAFVLRAADIGARQQTFSHPWNPKSEIIGVQLGKMQGLKRGVSIVRIPSGKESYVPHAHQREEEWVYILMGQAMALFGDTEIEVGAGDFLAYPAPQVAHHLRNVGADDLVYLMGGDNPRMDVVDFPTLGKRAVRIGSEVTIYEADAGFIVPMDKPAKKKKKA